MRINTKFTKPWDIHIKSGMHPKQELTTTLLNRSHVLLEYRQKKKKSIKEIPMKHAQ